MPRPRRDRDIGVTVSRRDRDVQKNASRLSRDRDVRDRDYNPVKREHYTAVRESMYVNLFSPLELITLI